MDRETPLGIFDSRPSKSSKEAVENNEQKQNILEAIADIKRKMSSEFYADPNKRILPEFYKDSSPECKQRLQDLKRNKFRKGWFTAILWDLQLSAKLLDGPKGQYLIERVKEFNKEVVATPEVDYVLIAKCEGLAKVAIKLLHEKLEN